MGVGDQRCSPTPCPGKQPLPIVQDAGLAPGLVWWTDAENIAVPGFDLRTLQPVASQIPVDFTSPLYSALEFVNILAFDLLNLDSIV